MRVWAKATQPLVGLDRGCSQSKVTAASSLKEGREPPYTLSEEIKAQWGPASLCMSSPQACASCPQNNSNRWVWRQLAERGWRSPAAPHLLLKGGGSSSTHPPPAHGTSCSTQALQPAAGRQRVNDAQGAGGSLLLALSGTMGPLWEARQVWADPGTGSYPLGGSLPPRTLLHSGRRRVVAAGPSHGPWKKTGPAQPQEHHASVAGGPAEQPRSYQFVWVQNEVRQPQAQSCQPTPACSRPDCELAAEHCQHCQHRTWVSSRISCALRMRYGRTGAGGTRFFSPQSHISMVGASADLGPRASGEPENSST